MDKITVAVLGEPDEPTLKGLDALGPDVELKIAKTADGLGAALNEARVLYNWSGNRAEIINVLARAPKLEWIQTRSAGLDGILSPELLASPVPLTNGSGCFSQSLGEFVITGALYWAKDLPRMQKAKAERRWDVFSVDELSTQTMGIVGHGDIGRAISKRAKALGMRVLALRRDVAWREGDQDVDQVYPTADLHQMLPECDYLVVAAPLTPTTKHLMSTAEFALMKPTAIIMNVGRGPVIDEAAMAEALRTKQIRGAALDVFEVEPLPADSPMWDLDNVLMSAHTADHTKTWLNDAIVLFLEQFGRWRRGEPLQNIADKRAGY
ncbi:MAG: D-isomer specific 2-hydroxyacid dehydrogenase, NAD-binding [Bryobacterales bacterium]|nr:D-isomer specific 2-hydroxyacid dehydrogenase, NAD-binding [Bryobacterales bacterium]